MKIKISIIIPHYNNFQILLNCIESIYKSTFKDFEIIVVDNGSSDSSDTIVKKKFPKVIVKKSEINLGYAGGCNLGSKISKGEYLLFLNNDTIIEKKCIENLFLKIESNSNISSVQPKILNFNNKSFFDYAGASGGFIDYLVYPFARGRVFNTTEKDTSQYDKSIKIFWASGACFLTKKKAFENLNGFDENLFAHMEEIDYHWKCHLKNYDVWVEPKAILFHYGAQTLKVTSPQKTYLNHRNSLILLLSNYSLIRSITYFFTIIPLEILSSFYDLFNLRICHFIAHYKALLSILFNLKLIAEKRNFIRKIRLIDDNTLFNKKIVLNKSIVIRYFFMRVVSFKDL